MKMQSLLLLTSSLLVVEVSPLGTPAMQVVAQTASNTVLAAVNPSSGCARSASAVVTIYAGSEIGSGSIVRSDGMVITNNHVVKQIVRSSNQPIYVKLASGDRFRGQLIKTDVQHDLALIQMNAAQSFPTVPLASDTAQPGQRVCAIGSPFGQAGVLTQGNLSLIRRNGDLQSNVLLNPGNSGGPLLNAEGEMIGVNRAILESSSGRNTGISIATSAIAAKSFIEQSGVALNPSIRTAQSIPAPDTIALPAPDSAKRVVKVNPSPSKVQLGVRIDTRNLVVRQVESGSPAAIGGLRPGDQLTAVNGNQLTGFDALQAFLDRQPNIATFTVRRNQQIAIVQVSF